MKIRFGKNDILDTKNIEGEGADISELETAVETMGKDVELLTDLLVPESLSAGSEVYINAGMTSLYTIFADGTLEVDSNGFVKVQSNG